MQCPGQDSRYWDGEAIFESTCKGCGASIEFFKDDSKRRCRACGAENLNPKIDFGCAAYCPYAEQCLGTMPPELLSRKQDLLIDRVALEMKQTFGQDFRRIGHATKVARHAGAINETEGGNRAVVLVTAYLHDIGIHEAERKYQSTSARHQHEEGPPIARAILERLGANPGLTDEVCDIIGHHHWPRAEETINFKIVYDADLIVNLDEERQENPIPPARLANILEKSFLTESGRRLAAEVLAAQSNIA